MLYRPLYPDSENDPPKPTRIAGFGFATSWLYPADGGLPVLGEVSLVPRDRVITMHMLDSEPSAVIYDFSKLSPAPSEALPPFEFKTSDLLGDTTFTGEGYIVGVDQAVEGSDRADLLIFHEGDRVLHEGDRVEQRIIGEPPANYDHQLFMQDHIAELGRAMNANLERRMVEGRWAEENKLVNDEAPLENSRPDNPYLPANYIKQLHDMDLRYRDQLVNGSWDDRPSKEPPPDEPRYEWKLGPTDQWCATCAAMRDRNHTHSQPANRIQPVKVWVNGLAAPFFDVDVNKRIMRTILPNAKIAGRDVMVVFEQEWTPKYDEAAAYYGKGVNLPSPKLPKAKRVCGRLLPLSIRQPQLYVRRQEARQLRTKRPQPAGDAS